MSLRTWRLWGAFLLLPFIGCRSEKAAFAFQPSTPQREPAAYIIVLSDSASVVTTATNKAGASHSLKVVASTFSPNEDLILKPIAPKRLAQTALPIVQLKRKSSAALANHAPTDRRVLNFVLGGALVIGGVVAGLLLGGWLGLGVGALIVLLGYYFLILGMGGPHAWTEIFQEFFNL